MKSIGEDATRTHKEGIHAFGSFYCGMQAGGASNTIIEAVWANDESVENNTLDAFISSLRNR